MFGFTNIIFVPMACLLSLVWGSFMGAALHRIPLRFQDGDETDLEAKRTSKLSLWKGRSQCVACEHVLSPLDLIPLLSWLFLKGKCRYCGSKIGSSYFCIEFWTLVVFLISFYGFNLREEALLIAFLTSTLSVMSLIDLKYFILPDELQWVLVVLAFFYLVLN